MATDLSVRQELIRRGVPNEQIGWNPNTGTVTIGGQDFMKPTKIINNTAFTDPTAFNTAYEQYQKSLQPTQTVTTVERPQTGMSSTYISSPSTTQTTTNTGSYQLFDTNAILRYLMDSMQNQQPIDPYSTEAFRAAQAQIERAKQQQIRAAQESYGAAGMGLSSALGERIARIGEETQEYLLNQVVPQIIAQEQAKRQQELQNRFALLDALMGIEGLALQRAGVTGRYMPPGANQLISDLLALKEQAERPGTTPDQLAALRRQADTIRNQLRGMGVDASLFGADVPLSQAEQNILQAGIPTLAAQAQQFGQMMDERQQALRELQVMAALTGFLPDGTPTTDEQQRQLMNLWTMAEQTGVIPDALADMYGIPRGTQTMAAKQMAFNQTIQRGQLGVSQMNAATNRLGALLDLWKLSGSAPEGIPNVAPGTPLPVKETPPPTGSLTANQFYDAISRQYLEPVTDEKGLSTGDMRITTDPDRRREMFWQVVDAGYDNATTDQILRALGFTSKEIEQYAND